jgi:beta-phosphoglucomutase-like phosphatase (HAD superfamily)
LTGKGSGRRIEDINKIRNNWDSIFKKRDKKQITKVIIEFEMLGYPSIDEMRNYVEKLHKEDKLVFLTTTTNA